MLPNNNNNNNDNDNRRQLQTVVASAGAAAQAVFGGSHPHQISSPQHRRARGRGSGADVSAAAESKADLPHIQPKALRCRQPQVLGLVRGELAVGAPDVEDRHRTAEVRHRRPRNHVAQLFLFTLLVPCCGERESTQSQSQSQSIIVAGISKSSSVSIPHDDLNH